MKIRLLSIFCLIFLFRIGISQIPSEIYKKPLKEVITDIEKKYGIKILYSEKNIKDLYVIYPTWRYRSEIEPTLNNILMPLDFIYQKTSENVYQISKYAYYQRPVEEGKKHLDKLLASYPDLQQWENRKADLRKCFLEQLRLSPLPKKTPLNPLFTKIRSYDGYTVENVAIETLPGVYLSGSLYKPSKTKGPFAAVLCPHGHFTDKDMNMYGRYRPDQQYRCANLARMGAVVFSYDMFAWGESLLQFDSKVHDTGLAMTVQTWNSMRVIDFLTSLQYVDKARIGITAASGGGTQSFLLTALDDRVSVCVPVVMVSSYFFGGCECESGMPIHSCTDLGTNNAEIAAMASPRPMLVVSDGSDWTQNVPKIEFPYLQKVYALYGKQENVVNVHLANEAHDYGVSKRMAMYGFMAKHLKLNLESLKDKAGKIDESKVIIEKYESMLVFGMDGILPGNAIKDPEAVWSLFKSLQ